MIQSILLPGQLLVCSVLLITQSMPKTVDVMTLDGSDGSVFKLAFSRDGKTLASIANDDGLAEQVTLWDLATQKKLGVLKGNKDAIFDTAFHPDGKILGTGSADSTIILWDYQTGRRHSTVKVPDDVIPADFIFAPDGKSMIIGTLYYDTVYVWDLTKDKLIATKKEMKYGVMAIACSNDSSTVAVGCGDGRIKLYETKTGKEGPIFGKSAESFDTRKPIIMVSFLPNDKELLSVSTDKLIRRWNIKTGKETSILLNQTEPLLDVVMAPNRNTFATGDEKGMVRLWDAKTSKLLETFEGHTKGIRSLAFNPEGTVLASGGVDRTIKLWEIKKPK
jgi:WD40 repeat protein